MWWSLAAAALGSFTALVIAFVAYPWQKSKDRKNETLKEQRKAVAELVSPIEECAGMISDSVSVFSATVPDISAPLLDIRKATSLARVYGASEVANQADVVRKELREACDLLEIEKSLRPLGYEDRRLPRRPDDYKVAQEKTNKALLNLNRSLKKFYSRCSQVLGVIMKTTEIEKDRPEHEQ